MNQTRIGKIARLPRHIRHLLNRRLEDGEPGRQVVEWLNGLREVQEKLECHFGGRPISEQNLSEWRKGGYLEWVQHEDSRDLVEHLSERSGELELDGEGQAVSDRFATLLAVEVVRVSEALLKESADPQERWQRLREVLQELGQLRRNDHQAGWLRVEQERRSRETDRLEEEAKRRAGAPAMGALSTVIGDQAQSR